LVAINRRHDGIEPIMEGYMRLLCFAAMAGLAVTTIVSPGARAADPEFCQDYARSAVEQANHAMHRRSCQYLVDGGRFSLDYRNHYNWCLNAHRHEADEERFRRHEALERCEYR
jgi:hypothetical protein